MFKHPDPMRFALKISLQKIFSNRFTFRPSSKAPKFGLENRVVLKFRFGFAFQFGFRPELVQFRPELVQFRPELVQFRPEFTWVWMKWFIWFLVTILESIEFWFNWRWPGLFCLLHWYTKLFPKGFMNLFFERNCL